MIPPPSRDPAAAKDGCFLGLPAVQLARVQPSGEHSVNRHQAFVVLVALTASAAQAQAPVQPVVRPVTPVTPVTPTASATPASHVAVIDVGYIFKNHTSFKVAMDRMKDEVLAAENAVLAQRRLNVDLAARALDAQVGLAHALGGGWRPAPATSERVRLADRSTESTSDSSALRPPAP